MNIDCCNLVCNIDTVFSTWWYMYQVNLIKRDEYILHELLMNSCIKLIPISPTLYINIPQL